jgi:drug/metabolite transporter (DMT)-like permease
LLRGTLGYGSITCFFLACQLLPLADATTFTFLAPLIVACLSPLVLDERPGKATWLVIPCCLTGVLLVSQPEFIFGRQTKKLPLLGILCGLGQPLFSATAKVRPVLLCMASACFDFVKMLRIHTQDAQPISSVTAMACVQQLMLASCLLDACVFQCHGHALHHQTGSRRFYA